MNMSVPIVTTEEYQAIITQHEPILKKLEEICIESMGSIYVEGNVFCQHGNIRNRLPVLVPKQINLFSLGTQANTIMEVGFNAGHSALLFMLANPHSKLVAFDICHHAYTIKCFEYLKSLFGDRLELIVGDSTVTVPKYRQDHPDAKFDLYHLDGCHDVHIARQDFDNAYDISDIIIFDDTQSKVLDNLLNEYISQGKVVEVPMLKTSLYEHRIVKRIH